MTIKPGIRTTEFIVSVLTAVGALTASLVGELSPRYAAIASAISIGAYAISRGLAKRPALPHVIAAPPGGSPVEPRPTVPKA